MSNIDHAAFSIGHELSFANPTSPATAFGAKLAQRNGIRIAAGKEVRPAMGCDSDYKLYYTI